MEINDSENSIPKPEQSSPYVVPDGYFSSLSARILARIEKEEDSELSIEDLTQETPFSLPDNYFNTLSSKVEDRLKREDAEYELSISGLTSSTPFKVPESYFDELPGLIEEKIYSGIATEELESANKLFAMRFYRLAMAACLGGIALWFGINIYTTSKLDRQMNNSANIVTIDNKSFDLNYFDESMLVEEVVTRNLTVKNSETEKTDKLENYILNNVDEDTLLQGL